MFNTYECDSLAEAYLKIYKDVLRAPEVSPRGMRTLELIAPQILIKNPRNRLAFHPDRNFSVKYALVESLMIFDPTNELKYYERFNKNIAKFSDDGEHLYGAYGYRIAQYIAGVIEMLENDQSSRQIVLPILRMEDVVKHTKDTPCTISLQLLLRDGQLNMVVNMRSNDIILGLPYDVFVFTTLQEVIANTLGLKLGWYLHRPASLHLYEENFDLFLEIGNKFKNINYENLYEYSDWVTIKNNYKNMVDGKAHGATFELAYEVILEKFHKVGEFNVR